MERGTFGFEVDAQGSVIPSEPNIDRLRRLWLDRTLVSGAELGPGVADNTAWHVACHLVAGGVVRRGASGQNLWIDIGHDADSDTYMATVSWRENGRVSTSPLSGGPGRAVIASSNLLGFVEGTSEGRITARGAQDRPGRFGGYARQNYDHPPGTNRQGGRVWEHWCTTRDLDPASRLSRSLLTAYLELCHAGGDLFAPTVARGRGEYGHPAQLRAMIVAGLTTLASARWPTTPVVVPREAELLLQEARPTEAVEAIDSLPWVADRPTYFMFARRIGSWQP